MSRVHFTHHLCRQLGIPQKETALADRARYLRTFVTEFGLGYDFDLPYAIRMAIPRERSSDIDACRISRFTAKNPAFTTVARDVTCKMCREEMAYDTKKNFDADKTFYKVWHDDDECIRRAWWVCCRHAGVPSPFASPTDEREWIAGVERAQLGRRADRVRDVDAVALLGIGPNEGWGSIGSLSAQLARQIEKIPAADRPHLKRMLKEAKRVDAQIDATRASLERLANLRSLAAICVQNPKRLQRKGRATPTLKTVVRELAALGKAS